MLKKELYYKQFTKDYAKKHLTKSKGEQYVCPYCGSGTKAHGTGAFTLYEDGFCCHSCNKSGDLLDLIGYVEKIPDHRDRLARAEELYGPIDDQSEAVRESYEQKSVDSEKEAVDYTGFFSEMHEYIEETDYWKKRGLSEATVNRFNLGYDSNWKHPNKKDSDKILPTPRLIIPCGKESYLARDTRPGVTKGTKMRVGRTTLFNEEALFTTKSSLWILEGEIDAMSIVEVGGEAVAIGSTSRAKSFIERIENQRPKAHLVLWFDTDAAGQRCTEIISEGLTALDVPFTIMSDFSGCKDANAALCKNKEEFCKMVKDIEKKIEETKEREKTVDVIEKTEYLKNSNVIFLNDLLDEKEKPLCIPTGFPKFDRALNGGLYEGLYVTGGVTAVGKTTFTMQLGDKIAQNGNHVMVFSLEMARKELMAKSISRHSVIASLQTEKTPLYGKTMREVIAYPSSDTHEEKEKEIFEIATNEYRSYAKNLFVVEGVGNIGVKKVREKVEKHIELTGCKPVVIIDYCQILAPTDPRLSDKANVDVSVLELKRLSRDLKIPVLILSSFNRNSYKGSAALDSFKESGAIEYSCDALFALQGNADGGSGSDHDRKNIEVSILKNRNGIAGIKVPFRYYPKYNYFEEA